MQNLLAMHYEKKRQEILLNKEGLKHDNIAVTEGIRIERTVWNDQELNHQQPILKQQSYDDHYIYFHFVLDADIHMFTSEGLRLGHMTTDKVYQVMGNRTLIEENLKPNEKKLTFIISIHLLERWQQDYKIPEWLDYTTIRQILHPPDFVGQIP